MQVKCFDSSVGRYHFVLEGIALTRKFYQQLGYEKEAVIRDFWDTGDDKVTFRKVLKEQ